MKLSGMYGKLFGSLVMALTLFASPTVIQAKSSAPTTPPANNSFNSNGRDKHSDELYQSYQQRRAGAGTQTPTKDSKAATSANSRKPVSTIRYSPIKKILFRASPAAAPKGAGATPTTSSKGSSSKPSSKTGSIGGY